jgi:hypothetical protein
MANAGTWERARAVLRGLWAVAVLFVTAADALITAALGVPPAAWALRRVRRAASDEYQRGYWHATDAEVVESHPGDPADGPPPEEEGGGT